MMIYESNDIRANEAAQVKRTDFYKDAIIQLTEENARAAVMDINTANDQNDGQTAAVTLTEKADKLIAESEALAAKISAFVALAEDFRNEVTQHVSRNS